MKPFSPVETENPLPKRGTLNTQENSALRYAAVKLG
ncbi:MAG: hypothetical protein UY03_C0020G0001 [Parcubacteria group bacterium GW2011_GWA2_47_64]|nr:MAG: hypothetical protein UY03_C0020G0001 [Parcubacteria group bacterium GW2011_GWA2_47_64]KKU95797.1 MAG: hypothetical protein UY29_C0019G0017 [Parcubacteria group bacterium GW2011_GWC2_48_17]